MTIGDVLDQASQLLAIEHSEEALALLCRRRATWQDVPRYWALVARAHSLCGDDDAAMAALEAGTSVGPLDPSAQLLLACLYSQRGFPKSASAIFDHLLAMPQQIAEDRPQMIRELGSRGLYDWALKFCEQETDVRPEQWQAWHARAYYLSRCHGAADKIIPLLSRALALNPTNLGLRISLVEALDQQGLDEDARQAAATISVDRLVRIQCGRRVLRLAKIYKASGDNCRWKACLKRYADLRREKYS